MKYSSLSNQEVLFKDSRPVVNKTKERGLRKYRFSMHAAHFRRISSSQKFVIVAHFALPFGALA